MGLLDILQQYANPATAPTDNVHQHFDQVAQQSSPQDLGNGVAAAFRSDATPPFGQMIGTLFGQSNPQQRAGILNQLVQALGTGALSSVAGGVLGRALGSGGATPTITPEQASQVSPADAATIAEHAEQKDPSILDRAGQFYAQHPQLVKGLGAAALAVVLGRMRSQS
ncbi:MAG: hypothetical protein JO090_15165 [Rhizobacter sp.]|nr:hypothetical protein [Rhizobacter sp.]